MIPLTHGDASGLDGIMQGVSLCIRRHMAQIGRPGGLWWREDARTPERMELAEWVISRAWIARC